MPMRKEILSVGEVYHVYNRGAGKQDIFDEAIDSWRFLQCVVALNEHNPVEFYSDFSNKGSGTPLIDLLGSDPHVEVLAYALNPNHFHLVLKQLSKNGISKYMQKIGAGFTNYMNRKYPQHSGALFQGPFKARLINSEEHLQYILAYVHGNDLVHGLSVDQDKRIRTSRFELLSKDVFTVCNHAFLRARWTNPQKLISYIETTARDVNLQRTHSKLNLE